MGSSAYFINKTTLADNENKEEEIVFVRHTLVIAGYAACIGILVSAIVLVVIATPSLREDSKYISEGMEAHCGWSVIMMGTCSSMIAICQVVAAAHMKQHVAILFSVLQLLGWNIVLGVVDTGWNLHYAGLLLFLCSNICYHWIASHDDSYGNDKYRWTNQLTMACTLVFAAAAITARQITTHEREAKACAVSLELVLTFASMLENMWLIHGLDQFESIHLVFEKKGYYDGSAPYIYR